VAREFSAISNSVAVSEPRVSDLIFGLAKFGINGRSTGALLSVTSLMAFLTIRSSSE
jgi:hypothetical protein